MFGGVEAGGTKLVCVIGTGPDAVVATARIAVTTPVATLATAVRFFRDAIDRGVGVDAVGVGSFGPMELRRGHPDHGRITTTPKPGWSGTDMVGPFADALGVPVAVDTDVNAAALAEGRWGAARGLASFAYLTLGTGIGGGAVAGGRLVGGLGHPEMGHVPVPRCPGDAFVGVCPFHGECLEGMASGTAIQARFGRRAETLGAAEREAAAGLVGFYVAAGIRAITYVVSPQRVILGGGVSSMPGVVEAVRAELPGQLAGYPGIAEHSEPGFVVPAALGGMAGPLGALILGEHAQEVAQQHGVPRPLGHRPEGP